MAIKTIITKVDDIDGSPAVASYAFTWAGVKYQIDLSKAHSEEIKADVAKWVAAARRVRYGGRVAGSKNLPKAEPAEAAAKPAVKAAAKPAVKAAAKPAAKAAAKPAAKAAAKPAAKAAAKPAKKTGAKPAARRAAAKKSTGPDPALVRAWANAQGIKVADRGRLAPAVVEQYVKAHTNPIKEEIAELAAKVEMPHFSMPHIELPKIN